MASGLTYRFNPEYVTGTCKSYDTKYIVTYNVEKKVGGSWIPWGQESFTVTFGENTDTVYSVSRTCCPSALHSQYEDACYGTFNIKQEAKNYTPIYRIYGGNTSDGWTGWNSTDFEIEFDVEKYNATTGQWEIYDTNRKEIMELSMNLSSDAEKVTESAFTLAEDSKVVYTVAITQGTKPAGLQFRTTGNSKNVNYDVTATTFTYDIEVKAPGDANWSWWDTKEVTITANTNTDTINTRKVDKVIQLEEDPTVSVTFSMVQGKAPAAPVRIYRVPSTEQDRSVNWSATTYTFYYDIEFSDDNGATWEFFKYDEHTMNFSQNNTDDTRRISSSFTCSVDSSVTLKGTVVQGYKETLVIEPNPILQTVPWSATTTVTMPFTVYGVKPSGTKRNVYSSVIIPLPTFPQNTGTTPIVHKGSYTEQIYGLTVNYEITQNAPNAQYRVVEGAQTAVVESSATSHEFKFTVEQYDYSTSSWKFLKYEYKTITFPANVGPDAVQRTGIYYCEEDNTIYRSLTVVQKSNSKPTSDYRVKEQPSGIVAKVGASVTSHVFVFHIEKKDASGNWVDYGTESHLVNFEPNKFPNPLPTFFNIQADIDPDIYVMCQVIQDADEIAVYRIKEGNQEVTVDASASTHTFKFTIEKWNTTTKTWDYHTTEDFVCNFSPNTGRKVIKRNYTYYCDIAQSRFRECTIIQIPEEELYSVPSIINDTVAWSATTSHDLPYEIWSRNSLGETRRIVTTMIIPKPTFGQNTTSSPITHTGKWKDFATDYEITYNIVQLPHTNTEYRIKEAAQLECTCAADATSYTFYYTIEKKDQLSEIWSFYKQESLTINFAANTGMFRVSRTGTFKFSEDPSLTRECRVWQDPAKIGVRFKTNVPGKGTIDVNVGEGEIPKAPKIDGYLLMSVTPEITPAHGFKEYNCTYIQITAQLQSITYKKPIHLAYASFNDSKKYVLQYNGNTLYTGKLYWVNGVDNDIINNDIAIQYLKLNNDIFTDTASTYQHSDYTCPTIETHLENAGDNLLDTTTFYYDWRGANSDATVYRSNVIQNTLVPWQFVMVTYLNPTNNIATVPNIINNYTVTGRPYEQNTVIYKLNNDSAVNINGKTYTVDTCSKINAVVYFLNDKGGWDWLIPTKVIEKESLTKNQYTSGIIQETRNTNWENIYYNTEVKNQYVVTISNLDDKQSKLAYQIYSSPFIYIHFNDGNIYSCNCTDKTAQVKTFKTEGRKMWRYDINLELSQYINKIIN